MSEPIRHGFIKYAYSASEYPYGYSPGGIQGYNIEQTQAPGGFIPSIVPMVFGAPLENRVQEGLLRRGWLGGRGFRQYLEHEVSGDAGTAALKAMNAGKKTRLEPLFRKFLTLGRRGKLPSTVSSAGRVGQGLRYGGTNVVSDLFTLPIRLTQNAMRINKLRPAAAREGQRTARSNPFLTNYMAGGPSSVKGAALEGESMKKKSNMGPFAGQLAASLVGSTAANVLGAEAAGYMKDRRQEASIGRNWDRLIRRYPEFNKADYAERQKVMDIFEGLQAMSPEITKSPVLTAPLLRNALEYGMQGFSPADMKTLSSINSDMQPTVEPGHKLLPKDVPSLFGGGNVNG